MTWSTDLSATTLAAVAVGGAVTGSFLTVLIHRLPEAPPGLGGIFRALSLPRSHCPDCCKPLAIHENIPLISFALLGGRCSDCGSRISWHYPIVEMLAVLLALSLAWRFGLSLAFAAAGLFAALGLGIAAIDLRTLRVPDRLSLPLLAAGLGSNYLNLFVSFLDSAIGAAAGFITLGAIRWVAGRLMGREALGLGDVKLFAALGAWVGWQGLPLTLFLASLLGSVVGLASRREDHEVSSREIAFGPFLVVGGLIVLMGADDILRLYMQLSGIAISPLQ